MTDSIIVFRKRNMSSLNVHSYKNFQKDFFHKNIKSLYFVKRNKGFTSRKRNVPKVMKMPLLYSQYSKQFKINNQTNLRKKMYLEI